MPKKKTKPKRPQIIMVTDGCGCIYCDLDLAPQRRRDGGQLFHHTQAGFVACTKPE